MEQHVHTVESVAACFFCSAQKQGFPGVVDDVPHYQTRMEEGRIGNQRSIRAGGHAYRGGVDEDVGLVQTFFQRYFIRQIKKPDVAVAFSMNAFYLLRISFVEAEALRAKTSMAAVPSRAAWARMAAAAPPLPSRTACFPSQEKPASRMDCRKP